MKRRRVGMPVSMRGALDWRLKERWASSMSSKPVALLTSKATSTNSSYASTTSEMLLLDLPTDRGSRSSACCGWCGPTGGEASAETGTAARTCSGSSFKASRHWSLPAGPCPGNRVQKRSKDTGPVAPCKDTLRPRGTELAVVPCRDGVESSSLPSSEDSATSLLKKCTKFSRLSTSRKRSRKFVSLKALLHFSKRSRQLASSTMLQSRLSRTRSPSHTPRKT
mmetsp:Transcript_64304/g.105667  ORF Transcript_64304/g.105667 Transcript_64304/m.105667 type:complete len:223 (+) Transcript_64304:93-761(+)